ncbi:MAG: helix-turn-helix transcriptional regulator [Bacteroidota bacterium]
MSGENKSDAVVKSKGCAPEEMRRKLRCLLELLNEAQLWSHDFPEIAADLKICIDHAEHKLRQFTDLHPSGAGGSFPETRSGNGGYQDTFFLERLRQLINHHIHESSLDVSFLAKSLHMSCSSLYRKIRATSGMSGMDFLTDCRMNHAARLLSSGTYLVKEVSGMAGFRDARYFSTRFKKHFRQTPTEYRRKSVVPVHSIL